MNEYQNKRNIKALFKQKILSSDSEKAFDNYNSSNQFDTDQIQFEQPI